VLPLRKIEGKYEVVRKLSEGGMGVLYLVRHRHLDELRVIKILRSTIDAESDLRGRFVREARSAIQLRHPNIAQLYDFSVDEDGSAYMVMEFIEGVNLEEFCRPDRLLEVPMVVEIAQQALRAMRFLHNKGYVHRDIAPDNLMLTRDAEGHLLVKLIDLGIVKVLRDETQKSIAGMYLGKPRYSSPEQLMGQELDGRADLYSLGIALFELLTGRFPISGNDFAALVTGHLYRPPMAFEEADPRGRVPEPLRRAVLKLLEKDRERRFDDCDGLAQRLGEVGVPKFEDRDGRRLEAVLGAQRAGEAETRPSRGGTQSELDRQFDEGRRTPSPGTIEELASRLAPNGAEVEAGSAESSPAAPPTPPPVAPPAPLTAPPPESPTLVGIRAALTRDDLPEATRLLAGATDEELGTPAVRVLIEAIEQRMAAREAERRGARAPDREALAWADGQIQKLIAEERAHPGAGAKARLEALASGIGFSAPANLDEHVRMAIEGGLAEAERLLRLGDTEAAAERLDAVEHGRAVWDLPAALQARFRTLEEETRALRIGARVARAERKLEEGSLVEAQFELEQARALDRSHPALAPLEARIRQARGEGAAVEVSGSYEEAAAERPPWLLPALIAGAVFVVVLVLLFLIF
jgi:serine/threonine-protein kinase